MLLFIIIKIICVSSMLQKNESSDFRVFYFNNMDTDG